jgi:1-acyl-sn-glycerol-3-phosphate acyltransferase
MINKIKLYYRIGGVVLVTLYAAIRVIFLFPRDKSRYRYFASNWGNGILRIFKVKLEIEGMEKLKKDQTYILASNHASLFDIPIMFSTFEGYNFVIVYKKELEKIPIFGRSLIVSPFIAIDREDPRNAMASIEKTLSQMEDNDCPIIFPEGTRSLDGNLQEFKRGAFLLASRSKKPIVPIAILGSANILRKGTLKVQSNIKVKVVINEPIENKSEMDRIAEKALLQDVFGKIKYSLELFSQQN